jgi:hypothetical protein
VKVPNKNEGNGCEEVEDLVDEGENRGIVEKSSCRGGAFSTSILEHNGLNGTNDVGTWAKNAIEGGDEGVGYCGDMLMSTNFSDPRKSLMGRLQLSMWGHLWVRWTTRQVAV